MGISDNIKSRMDGILFLNDRFFCMEVQGYDYAPEGRCTVLKSAYKSVYKIGVYLGFGAEANLVNSRFPVQLSSSLLTKGQMRNGGPFHPYFFCIDCRNWCIWRYVILLSPKLTIYSGNIHRFLHRF